MSRYTTSAEVKGLDEPNHRITVCVSTGNIGRDGIIVLPTAWEPHLQHYRANPVLLWMHPLLEHSPKEPWVVMGRAVEVRTEADGLWMTFQYAVDENPQAAFVWGMVASGYLRAFSVYWDPRRVVTLASPAAEIAALPDYARQALKTGAAVAVHTEAELFEVSQVVVGGDRDAITRALGNGSVSREAVARLCGGWVPHVERSIEMITQTTSSSPAPATPEAATTETPAVETVAPQEIQARVPETKEKAYARLPVKHLDCAARLETAAAVLRASEWYDYEDNEKMETIDGAITVVNDVAGQLMMMREELMAEQAQEGTARVASVAAPEVRMTREEWQSRVAHSGAGIPQPTEQPEPTDEEVLTLVAESLGRIAAG